MTFSQVVETTEFLNSKGIDSPQYGVILGTGLGGLADHIEPSVVLKYDEIPHFPLSTVETHSGKLIYGTLHDKKVLAMQGRFHYYEGYQFDQVTFPVRVMKLLKVSALLVSNAAGNLNNNWLKGDLMLLDDHIDLLPGNPLTGKNMDKMGPRFPDMSLPYDSQLNALLEEIARENSVTLRKGVYAAVSGPNLETRAEYRYLRTIGADAVGMSTIPENIVANHVGLPFCAISVLTDDCDPDNLKPVNISEIIEIAGTAEKTLTFLFGELIKQLE